jgi:uncharacterized membrane protein YhaH (DUF805 family)
MKVFRDYKIYDRRAGRKEYWTFTLFNMVVFAVFVILDKILGHSALGAIVEIVAFVFFLAILSPAIAVTIRRLHDSNKSGWWLLVVFIPFIGGVILFVLMLLDGTPGQNKFGANPKDANA